MSGEAFTQTAIEEASVAARAEPAARGIARNTLIFSVATGLSRIAGLVREIVASSYFATSGAFSAFTIAFQVPNLVRSLFADAAIQAAFVPVFTEELERGNRREAFRLASTLIFGVTLILGALTALFILVAPVLMPLFVGAKVPQDLTVALSRLLFPILVLLGTTGMVVGVLNSYNRFGAFAISPFFWNVAIATVLFPALSRYAARADLDGLRALLARGMRMVSLLLIPAAAATNRASSSCSRPRSRRRSVCACRESAASAA